MHVTEQFALVLKRLRKIVEDDLRLGFYPHTEPNPLHVRTSSALIDITLLREHATCARAVSLTETGRAQKLEELAHVVRKLLNGNWGAAHIEHFCFEPGCCDGHQLSVAVDRVYAALSAAWFEPLGISVPSTSRWHTIGPALAVQAGGMLCHQVLPRALQVLDKAAGVHEERADREGDGGADSWRIHSAKKLKQCMEVVGDQPATVQLWAIAALATEAVDQLSATLQHLDVAGYVLKELVSSTGCLLTLQQHTWALLNSWAHNAKHSSKLRAIMEHQRALLGEAVYGQSCYSEFRGTS